MHKLPLALRCCRPSSTSSLSETFATDGRVHSTVPIGCRWAHHLPDERRQRSASATRVDAERRNKWMGVVHIKNTTPPLWLTDRSLNGVGVGADRERASERVSSLRLKSTPMSSQQVTCSVATDGQSANGMCSMWMCVIRRRSYTKCKRHRHVWTKVGRPTTTNDTKHINLVRLVIGVALDVFGTCIYVGMLVCCYAERW